MHYIKKFEGFDFSQTIPITSKNFLTNYYHCDSCNALWKEFNKRSERCKFCNDKEIEELSEDEWYDTVKGRLDEEDGDIDEDRLRDEEYFLDFSDGDDLYDDENNQSDVN
jgi:hypothetical protein